MSIDRAKNSLIAARNLRQIGSAPLTVKDLVSPTDRDDLYRFKLGDRSQFTLETSGLRKGAKLAIEVFQLKGNALGKIGRLSFSDLKASDRNRYIDRLIRRTPAKPTSLNLALDAGNYYLRASVLRNQTPYQFKLLSLPLSIDPPTPPDPAISATVLYNGIGLPKDQGWLEFGQIPLPFLFDRPPFLSRDAKEATQQIGSNGVTLNSQILTAEPDRGYVGYGNYTVSSDDIAKLLNGGSLSDVTPDLVNSAFPALDRTDSDGFKISFKMALDFESSSNPNRAGFSVLVVSQDGAAIELGFKNNQIFAQANGFTAAESITPTFNLTTLTDYTLAVQGDNYQLFANSSPILTGSLRRYEFDPLASDPPLPLNPYTLPNFLFLGDNTDEGRATFTLGPITVTP